MKEVLETVSEVRFRSIAVVAVVALLAMIATWWILIRSASPSLASEGQRNPGNSVDLPTATPTVPPENEQFLENRTADLEQPEVLVTHGNSASSAAQTKLGQPEPPIPEQAESRYTVQIGAFKQENGARRRLEELKQQGYEAYLIPAGADEQITFRIVIGSFPTHDEASDTASRLKTAGIDAFVRDLELP